MRACSASSSIRISPTPRSRSVRVVIPLRPHAVSFHDAGYRYHSAIGTSDDRPAGALAARNLRVDEQVLHFFPPSREPVAGAAGAHLEARHVARDRPRPEADGAALEAEASVLAH